MAINKKIKIISIILGILFILVIIFNFFVSNFIEKKIKEALEKQDTEFHITKVDRVRFNLIDRSIRIDNIVLAPTQEAFSLLRQESDSTITNLNKVSISSVNLKGIHFLKILLDNKINIRKIRFENVQISKYFNSKKKVKDNSRKKIRLDSIPVKKIKGLVISKILVNKVDFELVDVFTDKGDLEIGTKKLLLGGFALNEVQEGIFKLESLDKELFVDHLTVDLNKELYRFDIDQIEMNIDKNIILVNNLKFRPIGDKYSLTKTFTYNKAVFDLDVPKISIYNFNIDKAINGQGIFIDSIAVSGVDADIYKDRRKPFDFRRRPKLPNQALKSLKTPVLVKKVKVNNSKLRFEEVLEKKNIHLKIFLFDIKTEITNITSVKEFMDVPMKFSFNSRFMKDAKLSVKMTFPLNEKQNRFYMDGRISKSKFKYFDSAIYPALGIKVLKGDLDGLTFNAVADENVSVGTMTLLYHNLETEVFKKKSKGKSKFLSWGVNEALHNTNPVKGKKPRVAIIHANRILYKGFINYVWITAQSGIINTLLPVGKTVEKEKAKADRKRKRKEKRNKKKK